MKKLTILFILNAIVIITSCGIPPGEINPADVTAVVETITASEWTITRQCNKAGGF